MKTRFFKYTARDAATNKVVFKSRMDDENILFLRKNENYNIKEDIVIFSLSRGGRDMSFLFKRKDIESISGI